jgi:ABC-type uncharacterized transport system substrate-binding protein
VSSFIFLPLAQLFGRAIVMVWAGDPVRDRLVVSLSRPGGNVTGLSSASIEVAGKNLEILREMLPSSGRIAVLANATSPYTKSYLAEIQTAARTARFEVQPIMLVPTRRSIQHSRRCAVSIWTLCLCKVACCARTPSTWH